MQTLTIEGRRIIRLTPQELDEIRLKQEIDRQVKTGRQTYGRSNIVEGVASFITAAKGKLFNDK